MDTISSYIKIGIVVVVLSICGLVYYKVTSYINSLKETITTKETEVTKYLNMYNDSQKDLALEKSNVVILNSKFDAINNETNIVKAKLDDKLKELELWKNKPVEIKYVEKVKNIVTDKNSTCEDGKRLMESISKLKYEEL